MIVFKVGIFLFIFFMSLKKMKLINKLDRELINSFLPRKKLVKVSLKINEMRRYNFLLK